MEFFQFYLKLHSLQKFVEKKSHKFSNWSNFVCCMSSKPQSKLLLIFNNSMTLVLIINSVKMPILQVIAWHLN